MTKAAAAARFPSSNDIHFGGVAGGCGGSKVPTGNCRRKTPTEFRSEMLKRKNIAESTDECPAPNTDSMRNVDGAVLGSKKLDSSKATRYTRMDEHYPVTKISRLLSEKESPKETVSSKLVRSLKNDRLLFNLNVKSQMQNSCLDDTASLAGGKECLIRSNNAIESCRNNAFVIPGYPSLGGETSNGNPSIDMGKGLIGLLSSCGHEAASDQLPEPNGSTENKRQSFSSKLFVPGKNIPLDLTLKTSMRVLSSSSVDWFNRLINCGTSSYIGPYMNIDRSCSSETASKPTTTDKVTDPGAFHSWVYPQSTLPPAAISALASVQGGQMDFLYKRQQAWEDSFRSLYYMLRKKLCTIFYVCSSQFVVMFTASDVSAETKYSCNAYISQSTRNLRSLLKEQDVSFSMPLCHSKVEEVTAEDLVELSEIEKSNLGQTRAIETMIGVDNTPQSLLMFAGSKNVHDLYDFLLNYRHFLNSLTGGDVPVLHSPVPFENASFCAPEVRCKQVRRIDYVKDSDVDSEPNRTSSGGVSYSIEVTDAYLPPWVICGVCSAMCSKGDDFQASFVTISSTKGLNIGLDAAKDKHAKQAMSNESSQEAGYCFGIRNATSNLQSAYLRGLKYSGGSCTASLSPVM